MSSVIFQNPSVIVLVKLSRRQRLPYYQLRVQCVGLSGTYNSEVAYSKHLNTPLFHSPMVAGKTREVVSTATVWFVSSGLLQTHGGSTWQSQLKRPHSKSSFWGNKNITILILSFFIMNWWKQNSKYYSISAPKIHLNFTPLKSAIHFLDNRLIICSVRYIYCQKCPLINYPKPKDFRLTIM